MPPTFDPYYKWLAIPPAEQPPNHYRLLALNVFESDPDVIATAADQRMAHVRSFQGGQYVEASQRLLNELAAARICLLKPQKKAAYDAALQRALAEQAARLAPQIVAAAPANSKPILDPPPLMRDAPAPIVPMPIAPAPLVFPAFQPEPAPATFVAETDRPDTCLEIEADPSPAQVVAAQALAGQSLAAQAAVAPLAAGRAPAAQAAVWDEDDPLGLGDSFSRTATAATQLRRRKPGLPRIFFIGPLLGVAAVVGAVLYNNVRDAMQQSDAEVAARKNQSALQHPTEPPLSANSKAKPHPGSLKPNPAVGFTPQNNSSGDTSFPSLTSGPDSPPLQSSQPASSESPSPQDKPEDMKPTAARLPVPSADAQQRALVEIKKVYKEEFSKANSLEGREALVRKLSDEATKTTDDPTMRYVMASKALEEAIKICDVRQASGLVYGLCFYYDVDSWELKSKTLVQLAAAAKSPDARLGIANLAYGLVDSALSEERYDAAVRLSSTASELAALGRDASLREKTREANSRAHRIQQEAVEVEAAQQRLGRQSDDAAAHLLIGRFYCMDRNDWESGLPHLVRGSDPDLSAIARREMAGAAQPAEQVALADAWWDLADSKREAVDPPLVRGMRNRAVYWYRRALGQLNGFAKSKAEKRIAEAAASTAAKPK